MKPSYILIASIGAGLALAQENTPPQPVERPPLPSASEQAPPPRPRPPVDGERPRFDQDRPPRLDGERPRRPNDQPPRFDRERPGPDGYRRPPEGGRPPFEGGRPPRPEGGRPPHDRPPRPEDRPERRDSEQSAQDVLKRMPQKPQPYLGLVTRMAGPDLSAQLRQPEGFGLVVDEVLPDSPAKAAGLERNDLLIRYEDQLIANPPQLEALVRRTGKDKEANLTIMRGGTEQKITIKIGEKMLPERRPYRQSDPFPGGYPINPEPRRLRGDVNDDYKNEDRQVTYAPQRARIERRDEDGRYELAPQDGQRTFVVLKADGQVAWRGPVETAEQREAIPKEWRPKLDLLERAIHHEPAFHERPTPPDAL